MKNLSLFAAFALLAGSGPASAQLLDEYDANSLPLGTTVAWAPTTGSDAATFAAAHGYSGTIYPGSSLPNVAPIVENTDPVFNGNNYVYFPIDSGLATSGALFTGASSRTLVAVYAQTASDGANTNPIAGQVTSYPSASGSWFDLQNRQNVVTGSPYLAGYAADLGNNIAPVVEQLTFALATYDGTTATLYWAFGTSGAINSVSTPLTLNTGGQFMMGFDTAGEPSGGQGGVIEIGDIQVYLNAMTPTQADATILALQNEYASVPEPAEWALMLGGLGALIGMCRVRRLSS